MAEKEGTDGPDRSRPLEPEERALLVTKNLIAQEELFQAQAESYSARVSTARAEEAEAERLATNKYQRIFTFDGAVDDGSVKKTIDTLDVWHRTTPLDQSFTLRIYSPGGDVIAGMFLFDHIKALHRAGRTVDTEAEGYAASMGGILLQAGSTRRMGKEAYVLIHQISFGVRGKVGEVEDEMEFVKKMSDRVLDIFGARAAEAKANGTATDALSRRQFAARWERKDWWLNSDECLKYGVVDEVL